jgi:hypothetical protein
VRDLVFRDLDTLLQFSHPYIDRFKNHLESFQHDLWRQLEATPILDPSVSVEVVSYLLELACKSENILNIDLGRAGLMALPKTWLLEHVQTIAQSRLDLQDDWEYRRLLEVAWKLDRGLVEMLTEQGLSSSNVDVREAAKYSKDELDKS